MTKYKLLLFPLCLILFSSFLLFTKIESTPISIVNDPIYKRVEVTLNSIDELRMLGALGIDLQCGVTTKVLQGKTVVTIEISEEVYDQIRNNGMPTKVLVEDLSLFYSNRAKQDLPIAIQQLEQRKMQERDKTYLQDMSCTEIAYPVPTNFNLGSYGGFLTYNDFLADLDKMANLYPNLITVKASASSTGQTTHEGRTVYYVKVSDNPNTNEASEPQVLYTGIHHAREPCSMMNINYYLWYLLENYNSDPKVKNLVDHTEMYFIPVVNPDGLLYNESTNPNGGGFWRKNRRNNGNGTFGVDLNRNYGYQWGFDNSGSSPSTSSDVYRGPSPFSEPETQIVKAFVESRNFINTFNNHAFGNLLLYPFGYANTATPDEDLYAEMSEQICWHNRYRYGRPSTTIFYEANGDSDSWFYGEQTTKNKIMAFTPEIGTSSEGGFYPSPTLITDQCERHLHMSLSLAEMAANHGIINDLTPYGLSSTSATLSFNIQHISLNSGSFTVNISSSDPNVTNIANPNISTSVLTSTDNEIVSTGITLAPSIVAGTPVTFDVVLNNGVYDIYSTTITKYYSPAVVFTDDCNSLANWTSNSWGVDNSTGFNANGSLTDSPTGNSSNGNSIITIASPLDFTDVESPVLEYYAKWDITKLFSYTQIEVSTGTNWTELCAEHTKVGVTDINGGNPDQPDGEALYDGYQENFVREQFDLSAYEGISTVYIRFKLDGDSEVSQRDGFWFDDFTIYQGNQCQLTIVEASSFQITNSQSAVISIETAGTHSGNPNVTYNAGEYVLLKPGFSTPENFEAIIQACQ